MPEQDRAQMHILCWQQRLLPAAELEMEKSTLKLEVMSLKASNVCAQHIIIVSLDQSKDEFSWSNTAENLGFSAD